MWNSSPIRIGSIPTIWTPWSIGFNALTYRDKGNFKTEEECWEQEKGAQRRIRPIENPVTTNDDE